MMRNMSMSRIKVTSFVLGLVWLILLCGAEGAIKKDVMKKIRDINKEGHYLGIVIPNSFEMTPFLQSSSFVPHPQLPHLDFAGKRFRFGKVKTKRVIVVMTGLSMLNAGITTQLLVSLFKLEGVLHFGIAGNANPQLQIGDVTIPQFWAHTGLWNWQRFGDGPQDELALEAFGDYTRDIGFLKFSDFNNVTSDNLLNNVWYQPEEIFPVDGTPEIRQHAYWVPVNHHYFQLAKHLEGMELNSCVNQTCLPRKAMVTRVKRGISANVFVDNAAYRSFLFTKFNATAIDMETAAVGLVCLQQRTPFLAIRALSDLAGGGSSESNEAAIFASLAAQNSVDVAIKFINLLG